MSSTKDVELLVLRHEVACSAAPTNDHALDARIPHVVPARGLVALQTGRLKDAGKLRPKQMLFGKTCRKRDRSRPSRRGR